MNFLEDDNLRFPHISEQILKELDNKSLTECRTLSTSMCDFIDNTKIPWMRMIRKCMPDWEDQQESWSILRRVRVDTVREIADEVHQFYAWGLKDTGQTPLHFAVRTGQMDIFLDIFERVKDKNPQDGDGVTPFHLAAMHGHLEICQLIVKKVEDKNPKNSFGRTPLDSALSPRVRKQLEVYLKSML